MRPRLALSWTLLLPFVAISLPAVAHSRLPIEVMPIEIVMDVGTYPTCILDCAPSILTPPPGAFDAGISRIREALGLLGVEPHEYDLIVSEATPQRLVCDMPDAFGGTMSCTHPTLGDFDRSRLHEMMIEFEGRRASWGHKGTVLIGILLLPEEFEWAQTLYGVNKWWSWNGFAADDLHWTTTSCSIWTAPWLRVVAHEIGHCFGLWHANAPAADRNYDGMDNSIDLMGTWSAGTHFGIRRLRPSNAARVRHHFRVLADDDVDVLPPMSPTPTAGRTAID